LLIQPQGEADKCQLASGPKERANEAVFVGFDTEWRSDPKRKKHNIVLAYALHVRCGAKASTLVIKTAGPKKTHRLSLPGLIGRGLQQAIDQGVLDGWPDEIYLAVHYGRGDFAACQRFGALKPRLTGVRGTLVTQSRPLEVDVEIDEKRPR